MKLPVMPPVKPMLAKSQSAVPAGMVYEPKWDGFRCIIFRDGDEVELGSRNEKPLTRYFPEVVEAALANLPEHCVVDGEIIIVNGDSLDFEALLQRIHPAASRVKKLAVETPASFVAFDLLALGDESLLDQPFSRRRELLSSVLASSDSRVLLTPATDSLELAKQWFDAFEGAGLDGVVAKSPQLSYQPDQRVMVKIKHERTADCVVAGFRWHRASAAGTAVGSLMLGLYNDEGVLQHVGVCGAFSTARRRELIAELEPYRIDESEHPWGSSIAATEADRRPGGVTRWNAGKDLSWVALRPELVCEVAYDHMEGGRFRHTAQFRRWRPDREPTSCTYEQLERPVKFDLADVLTGG
ncbi:MAG TPA: ATP-dependent DNA ligase [Acidothermaceae bacterium]|nr:ATP-dependent DNA ligase [Acidothermaceae bacterium]